MFTGIITNFATIKNVDLNDNKDCLLEIELDKNVDRNFDLGCSIACNGICLTLVKRSGLNLSFQASKETQDITTLANWQRGQKINIEFALRLGDEFGGHIVSGHVDGRAKLTNKNQIKDSWKMEFEVLDESLIKFITKKGSICVDGISLTVNEIDSGKFAVNIVSHTFKNTNLNELQIGGEVNIEVDLLARYVLKDSAQIPLF